MSAPRCFLPDTSVEVSLWFIIRVLHRITGKKSFRSWSSLAQCIKVSGGRNAWSFDIKEMAIGLCIFNLRLCRNLPPQACDAYIVWSPTHAPKGQEPHLFSFKCSNQLGRQEGRKEDGRKEGKKKGREGRKEGGRNEKGKEGAHIFIQFIYLTFMKIMDHYDRTKPTWYLCTLLKGKEADTLWVLAVCWMSHIFSNKNNSLHLLNSMSGIIGM